MNIFCIKFHIRSCSLVMSPCDDGFVRTRFWCVLDIEMNCVVLFISISILLAKYDVESCCTQQLSSYHIIMNALIGICPYSIRASVANPWSAIGLVSGFAINTLKIKKRRPSQATALIFNRY